MDLVGKLFARTTFQAFLFAGAVIVLLVSYLRETAPPRQIVMIAVAGIVLIALAAIYSFTKAHEGRPAPASPTQASVDPTNDTRRAASTVRESVRATRGFLLFGLLLYLSYHFLDQVVLFEPRFVERFLQIRLAVAAVITAVWLCSFFPFFRIHRDPLLATGTCIAGLGIVLMIGTVPGLQIHFYYEGIVLVICFAAFAFRLPPKHVAWVSLTLFLAYLLVNAYYVFRGDLEPKLEGVLLNNVIFLATFIVLALSANVLYQPAQTAAAEQRT